MLSQPPFAKLRMYPCPYLCLYYIAHPEKTEKSAIKKSARFGELAENVNVNLQLMIFAFNGFKVAFAIICDDGGNGCGNAFNVIFKRQGRSLWPCNNLFR